MFRTMLKLSLVGALGCSFTGAPGGSGTSEDAGFDADSDASAESDGASGLGCAPSSDDVSARWELSGLPSVDTVDIESARTFEQAGNSGVGIGEVGQTQSARPECGVALQFADIGGMKHGELGSDAGPIRALDLWVRVPELESSAIVSRDAFGDGDGHLLIMVLESEATNPLVVVRVQDAEGAESYRCAPIPIGGWFHLGVNLTSADASIWVDGSPASSSDFVDIFAVRRCGSGTAFDLGDAPALPMTIGASLADGPPRFRFFGGAIDNLRFHAAPQDFTL